MQRLAIFASGKGSNTANLIADFARHSDLQIVAVYCNKPGAGVVEIATNAGIPVVSFESRQWMQEEMLPSLKKHRVDWIVLAGFFWKVPDEVLGEWPERIVNLHPSLLPKFGGKGMYGHHVHVAVLKAKETKSGITIHMVNEHYDEGRVIAQFECPVFSDDTVTRLAERVGQLEKNHFPEVVRQLILNSAGSDD